MKSTKKEPSIVVKGDCSLILRTFVEEHPDIKFNLTFLDPPFNQDKEYSKHNDKMREEDYWNWMTEICKLSYDHSEDGAAIYFMQREKNAKQVLQALTDAGWIYQSLIIWKKLTSAVPQRYRFGKQYQIIVFATKSKRPQTFNRLRIDLPIEPHHKYERENGVFVTDIWSDIRELTAGYFAGDEAIRDENDNRMHKQQSPLELLLRIILSSTNINDIVLDPFAGSGTTAVACKQLKRTSVNIEIDPINVELINHRLKSRLKSDDISKHAYYYRFTENLEEIWPNSLNLIKDNQKQKNQSTTHNINQEILESYIETKE